MSLMACRECDQQVSTEAVTCPHCGAARPTATDGAVLAPSSRSGAYWFGIAVAAIVVALAVAFGGYRLWQSQQGVSTNGTDLANQIVETYNKINPSVGLVASCPHSIRLHQGRVVDCTLRRTDTGAATGVFITPTDDSGHFRIQIEDLSLVMPSL